MNAHRSWLAYPTVKSRFGRQVAAFSTIGLFSDLVLVLYGGNTVEELALPFNLAAIFLFLGVSSRASQSWAYVAVGCLATIPALFRPNMVGVGVAIALTVTVLGLRESDVWGTLRR